MKEILSVVTQRGQKYYIGIECDRIEEHGARGEGDKWFYDIFGADDDGANVVVRIFDPLEVRYRQEEQDG